MKKFLALILTVGLCFQIQAKSTSKQIDELLNELFDAKGPGGVALVVKNDKTIYRKAFGMANVELNVKMTPEHIFRIGSITKQFTAAAILKLVEEGRINLHDDITKFIKDYPTHGHSITVEHLLNHTSGIKSYTGMQAWDSETRKRDFTPAELVDYFKNQPMDFSPGEQFRYNNSGYILLGHIIEIVSGKSYADYIQESFFTPLGMTNSSYGSTARIIKNRAYGYAKDGDELKNADFLSMTQPFAAGSLLSTVDDLHQWYKAVFADRVISKDSRGKAHTGTRLNNGEVIDYGFGWSIGNIQGSPRIAHNGGINGFATASLMLPEENVFVAIFSNCTCTDPTDAVNRAAAIAIGEPFDWEKISLDAPLMQSYQAVYEKTPDNQRIITFADGQLFSMRSGGARYAIFPFAKDKFFFEGDTLRLEFNRDARGEIVSVTSKSTGSDQTWLKTNQPIPSLSAIEVDPAILQGHVGKYILAADVYIHVFLDGPLYLQVSGQRKLEMIPLETHEFVLKDTDIKISFTTNDNGQTTGLILHQNGDHPAEKVE